MTELRDLEEKGQIPFQIERSDLSIQVNFEKYFWSLFHDIPAFYSALLTQLRDFGVTPHSIRSEVADGSLGAYNVN